MVYRSDYVKKWLDYLLAIISQSMDMYGEGKKIKHCLFYLVFCKDLLKPTTLNFD
jgi:hypothetical protein